MGDGSKAGNFVETKKAKIGKGSKINHLSYIGDAIIGEKVNIGAGTITCNYDGYFKHKTTIKDGAFIGTHSSLVAPVTIGKGAFLGSGGVITDDVPDDALALARAKQSNKAGWAKRFHTAMQKRKANQKNFGWAHQKPYRPVDSLRLMGDPIDWIKFNKKIFLIRLL